mgnify:CR=1 FL=1
MPSKGSSRIIWLTLFMACLVALPSFLSQYSMHLMVLVMIYVVIATSWNILVWTHQISLGHAAFFGTGAYVSTLLVNAYGVSPWITLWLGGIAALVLTAGVAAVSVGIVAGQLLLDLDYSEDVAATETHR